MASKSKSGGDLQPIALTHDEYWELKARRGDITTEELRTQLAMQAVIVAYNNYVQILVEKYGLSKMTQYDLDDKSHALIPRTQ